jgi:endogenous inhibitor of DNA gyrase (YacG/DUF329 family)
MTNPTKRTGECKECKRRRGYSRKFNFDFCSEKCAEIATVREQAKKRYRIPKNIKT